MNLLTTEQWNDKNAGSLALQTGNENVKTNLGNVYNGTGQIAGFAGIDDLTIAIGAGIVITGVAVYKAASDGNLSLSGIGNNILEIGDKIFGEDRDKTNVNSLLALAGSTPANPEPDPDNNNQSNNNKDDKKQDENKNSEKQNADKQQSGNENSGSFLQNLRDKIGTRKVDITKIETNPNDDIMNRGYVEPDPKTYRENINYIRQTGKIKEPIEVIRLPNGKYQVVDGHHRLVAAKNAGLEKIPVKVVK